MEREKSSAAHSPHEVVRRLFMVEMVVVRSMVKIEREERKVRLAVGIGGLIFC